jgi:hypothetical protein
MTTTRLTRRTCRRGETVTVTETNGRTWTGTLTGWGTQLVDLRLDEDTQQRNGCTWVRKSFWVGGVEVTSR